MFTMRLLLLLQILLALLAATVLSAPTESAAQPRLQIQQSEQLITANTVAQEPTSRLSAWIARILYNKDGSLGRMSCFCAGGSLCCRDTLGDLDCNKGICGI